MNFHARLDVVTRPISGPDPDRDEHPDFKATVARMLPWMPERDARRVAIMIFHAKKTGVIDVLSGGNRKLQD